MRFNLQDSKVMKRLSDPISRLSIVSVLILILYVFYIVVISSYLNMLANEQTQTKLKQFSSLAGNSLATIEKDLHNKKIDRATAIKQSAKIISNMKYVGEYGLNSILFAKIDSDNFMVINDSTDQETNTSSAESVYNPENFNDLKNIAMSPLGSGFLKIKQVNPFTKDNDELIYYVSRIEHLNCFLATSLYTSETNNEMIKTVKIGQIFSLVFGVILLGQYFISIRTVRKQNEELQSIVEDNNRNQELLKKSEERFNLAFHNVNDGIWEYQYNDNLLYLSPKIYTMLGYSVDEFSPHIEQVKTKIHPEDFVKITEAFTKINAGETDEFSVEHRILCKDNSYKWIFSRGKVLSRNDKGKIKRIIGTHTDISLLKNKEIELKNSELKLIEILDSINDAVFIHDAQTGQIQMVNKKACEMFGVSRDAVTTLPFNDMCEGVSPYTEKEAFELLQKSRVQGEQYFEWHSKDSSGRLFWTDITMKNTTLNNQDVILVVVRNINEKKEAADKIRKSEIQLRAIAESIPFEFWAADSEGICFLQNSNSILKLGDIKGKHWTTFDFPEKQKDMISNLIKATYSGTISSVPFARNENDIEYHYQSYYAPIFDQKKVIGIMNILLDVTDRVKVEEILSHRNVELERLEKIMINREIKMVELKKMLDECRSTNKE